jgi:hypothetical protein
VLTLIVVALGFGPASERVEATASRAIVLPISAAHVDQVYWSDTWGAPRSGGRSHIGVDMMGPKMVPLVAVADSQVTWGRFNNSRGTIVRLRDDQGWEYQYIHINNDTPGTDDGQASCLQALAEKLCASLDGDRLQRGIRFEAGEFIGYLGDSGNAEWTGAHLHFEIYRPDGTGSVSAVNPTPFVDAARDRAESGTGPIGPWNDSVDAAEQIFRRLEGRSARSDEYQDLVLDFTQGGLGEVLTRVVASDPSSASLDRLYLAFFQRQPDDGGWDYWVNQRADGRSLENIAEDFASGDEYLTRYGGEDFGAFLDLLYQDVLGRAPDVDGRNYWLGELDAGTVNRGTIVVYFTEGSELRTKSQARGELATLHRALGLPRPTDQESADWRALRDSTELADAIETFLSANGY